MIPLFTCNEASSYKTFSPNRCVKCSIVKILIFVTSFLLTDYFGTTKKNHVCTSSILTEIPTTACTYTQIRLAFLVKNVLSSDEEINCSAPNMLHLFLNYREPLFLLIYQLKQKTCESPFYACIHHRMPARKQATLVYNERPTNHHLSAPIPIILINNSMHSVRGTLLLQKGTSINIKLFKMVSKMSSLDFQGFVNRPVHRYQELPSK